MCLLDAFVADDLDEKIEECMAQRHSAAAVHSTCVENHASISKPAYVVPGICKTGRSESTSRKVVKSIVCRDFQ